MNTKFQVSTGWSFLDRVYYTLQEAQDYVKKIGEMKKHPKYVSIVKITEEFQPIETTKYDN